MLQEKAYMEIDVSLWYLFFILSAADMRGAFMDAYDIFISYRTTHGAWVETLGKNLRAQGYRVFLDRWALIPGQHWMSKISEALASSRLAILVATPDTSDSGWVQQEYEMMVEMEKSGSGFFFIPVILGRFPDLPFLKTVQAVDFNDRTPEGYRQAFYRLLCGIEQKQPGADGIFSGPLTLPTSYDDSSRELVNTERSFVMSLFERLRSGLPQMVLAQDHTNMQIYGLALREEAAAVFGKDRVFHIFPPNSTRADAGAYFERLSYQCGFDRQQQSWKWAGVMEERLETGDEIFLLVTGFENGPDEPRRELAGELRALCENKPSFHLVMMGGERLAALKYEIGELSLLNIAQELPIPGLGAEDLRTIFARLYRDLSLTNDQMREALAFTGGHPLLLHHCLEERAADKKACEQLLRSSHLPAQLFTRFRDQEARATLEMYLQKEHLGRYELWPEDEMLRRLYWRNLVTGCNGALCWRCDFIRQIGLENVG